MGWLDHASAQAQFDWADLFVFTSLRDTTGTVALEALAAGTPVVCLDHQGVRDVVTESCGIKLPVTTPRKVCSDLRDSLVRCHENRSMLEQLSEGALRRAECYTWTKQAKQLAAVYEELCRFDREANRSDVPLGSTSDTSDAEHLRRNGVSSDAFAARGPVQPSGDRGAAMR